MKKKNAEITDEQIYNLSKEIFDLKAQNQMLKLKLSTVIAKQKISAEAAYKEGYENGENDEYHRWM